MTNTRITDLEILEHRYPVILKRFTLRPGSGGDGAYRGGDGVIREMLFRCPMTLSVLTERRSHNPPGLEGGLPGARGRNTLIRADGRKINLGPKTAVAVNPGVSDFFCHHPKLNTGYASELRREKSQSVFFSDQPFTRYSRSDGGQSTASRQHASPPSTHARSFSLSVNISRTVNRLEKWKSNFCSRIVWSNHPLNYGCGFWAILYLCPCNLFLLLIGLPNSM